MLRFRISPCQSLDWCLQDRTVATACGAASAICCTVLLLATGHLRSFVADQWRSSSLARCVAGWLLLRSHGAALGGGCDAAAGVGAADQQAGAVLRGTGSRGTARRLGSGSLGAGPEADAAVDVEDLAFEQAATRGAAPLQEGIVRRSVHRSPEPLEALAGEEAVAAAHLPGRQRVHVRTFGCPHNQSDGEYLMGQLQEYGYTLVDSLEECDACVVNSCTVKDPAEVRALNLVTEAQAFGKHVVLTGCVPSSDKKLATSLDGVSVLDVSQIDRIVDVVEETIKGNIVKLLEKKHSLPSLALPKVRKKNFAEIITINAGCLGSCTYCKTKLSRGKVISYPIDEIVSRAKQAVAEGVFQIELASEDMGAYGVDIGTNVVELLLALSDALPHNVMLRTGMTNPPYISYLVDGMVEALNRPNIHAFMHIPVQSGSDRVLQAMRREYTSGEFTTLVDTLKAGVPDLFLLTDIICGFPAESDVDWEETMALLRRHRFHGLHISQFYARSGTPAARLRPLKSKIPKERYKEAAEYITSYNRNEAFEGRRERVWFSDTNEHHGQTIGRTKAFAKVVVPRDDALLGRSAMVELGQSQRLHVEGQVLGELL